MNIIFVKWGTKYSSEQVNNLYESIRTYTDTDCYCYTDDDSGLNPNIKIIPIPTKPALKVWWNKLAMFSKDFPLSGKTLYLDIDTVIKDNPLQILEDVDFSKLTLVDCHWKDDEIYDRKTNYDVRINSSVIAWDADNPEIHEIWDWFINSGQKDYFLRKYKGIDRYIVHEDFEYNKFKTGFILSWKHESPYKAANIITFEELDFGSIDIKQNT